MPKILQNLKNPQNFNDFYLFSSFSGGAEGAGGACFYTPALESEREENRAMCKLSSIMLESWQPKRERRAHGGSFGGNRGGGFGGNGATNFAAEADEAEAAAEAEVAEVDSLGDSSVEITKETIKQETTLCMAKQITPSKLLKKHQNTLNRKK